MLGQSLSVMTKLIPPPLSHVENDDDVRSSVENALHHKAPTSLLGKPRFMDAPLEGKCLGNAQRSSPTSPHLWTCTYLLLLTSYLWAHNDSVQHA